MIGEFFSQKFPALAYRYYRLYWLGSFASVGASLLITMGLGWLIFELTRSPIYLGLLGAAIALPNLALSAFGGVLADRFNKKTLLMLTSGLSLVLMLVVTALDYLEWITVWQVLLAAACYSLLTGIDWPTRSAIFPLLVDRVAMPSAVALNAFIWQSMRMAMPAIGGILISVVDTWLIFFLGAVGFAIMCIVVNMISVDTPEASKNSPWRELIEGFKFVWQTPQFKIILGLSFSAMFFLQSYVQVLPALADMLGSGERGFGYLMSAGGLGSVVGALLLASFQGDRHDGHILSSGVAATGFICVFVFCVQMGWFNSSLFAVFLASALHSVFMIKTMTLMQINVPDELRGRVMGIHSMTFSFMPLGGLFLGGLGEFWGVDYALLLSALIYLGILLIVLAGFRQLLRDPA
ncbi:MAG: MFS transporter [Pseudomonadota bacterium]